LSPNLTNKYIATQKLISQAWQKIFNWFTVCCALLQLVSVLFLIYYGPYSSCKMWCENYDLFLILESDCSDLKIRPELCWYNLKKLLAMIIIAWRCPCELALVVQILMNLIPIYSYLMDTFLLWHANYVMILWSCT